MNSTKTYEDKLLFRKRRYSLDEFGISVEDIGLFKTSNKFHTYENVSPRHDYLRDDIINRMFAIIILFTLSFYLFWKFSDSIWVIIAFLAIMTGISIGLNILKESSYKGTLLFGGSGSIDDKNLYFKTSYPLSEDLKDFLSELRQAKIDFHYRQLLERNQNHQMTQDIYLNALNGLRQRVMLSEEEYDSLLERLKQYFQDNNISNPNVIKY